MNHKESFLRYLHTGKRYSPRTIRSYQDDLDQFISFLGANYMPVSATEINSHHVRKWIVSMMESDVSAVSVHRKISCLRVFFRFLRKENIMKGDPLEKVVLPKRKKSLPVFVEEKALDNLLDSDFFGNDFDGLRNKSIIEMLYLTGMRRSELTGLRCTDIDFSESTVKVTGKRDKQRIIPLTRSFSAGLQEYLKVRNERSGDGDTGWFFITARGKKLYDRFVYDIVRRYLSMVTTMDKKSPHVLRHTFATHMLNRGADLNAIKELLGHANLTATQVYTHNTFDKLKKIYKQAHPRA
jgi:integrase/recombinase XerC